MSSGKHNAFEVALQELHAVAEVMHLSDEIVGFLSSPQRTMEASIPLRMDDGTMKYFKAYRCQHNSALGPTRGGTRLHQDEVMDDVKALAFWMTVKNSLAGIPSGGGKGGIAVDPRSLSPDELQRLCRGYIRAIYPMLGPDVDVFGPDVGTPPQIMAWFLDEYETLLQQKRPTAFSGKPPVIGGSRGRDVATGFGLVYAVKELMKQNNTTLEGKRIGIQGFGNLGANAAIAFEREGAKMVAIADIGGGFYNPKGIDIFKAGELAKATGTVKGVPNVEEMDGEELWGLDVDILIPAALQNVIHEGNADKIKAKFVVEGANGPITPEGEAILLDKGSIVYPGIAANCGGVLVSYFEQVQNRYCFAWEEQEVLSRLEATLTQTCSNVCNAAREKKVSLRIAAWVAALDKVIEAMKFRGWVK